MKIYWIFKILDILCPSFNFLVLGGFPGLKETHKVEATLLLIFALFCFSAFFTVFFQSSSTTPTTFTYLLPGTPRSDAAPLVVASSSDATTA